MATLRNRQEVTDDRHPFLALLQQTKPITDKIAKFGFEYTFVPDYLLSQIAGNVQVRDIIHVAPSDGVAKVAEGMARGDSVDPIVVSLDNYLIDGHTRRGAAQRTMRLTLPAYVLNRKYADAASRQQAHVQLNMHMLATALNQHGLSMTKSELRKQIERAGPHAGYEAARLAQLLGVQESFVQNIFAEIRAKERFVQIGFEPTRVLTPSQLRSLGKAQLNNDPFKALCELTVDADLKPSEIDHIRKEAKEKRGDVAAVMYLEQEAEARADQIQQRRLYGKVDTSNPLLLRQRLGFIKKFSDNPAALCEHNPSIIDKHVDNIRTAIDILERVLIEQGVGEDL